MSRPKQPQPRPAPRLYLVTPPLSDAGDFAPKLASAVAAGDVAAVLLRLADADERQLINTIKALAPVAQDAGAALIVAERADLVARGGADGGHFADAASFLDGFESLRPDRIAGAGGLVSRHDAMSVAEAGADYVMFGEPDGEHRPSFAAVEERVAWWAEVFESPCVGFASSADEVTPLVAAGADFIAVDFVWDDTHGAAAAIAALTPQLRLPENVA